MKSFIELKDNLKEYHQLQAEIGVLERMLADLPVGREIEQISLMARKQEVEGACNRLRGEIYG